MSIAVQKYIGRFAPSPTGPLHFGSLIAAVGSYLDARANHGKWLLRIDDIDPPREQAGTGEDIIRTLEQFGFEWDGEVLLQSSRNEAYLESLQQLNNQQLLFYCTCSRKQIAEEGNAIYPGKCRSRSIIPMDQPYSVRIRIAETTVTFNDAIQGMFSQVLLTEVGDFILRRRDGFYGYHLAVTTDDAYQGISHVVRGADLLDSTPRQIWLQQLLNLSTPQYAHLPVAINEQGQKLSKQNLARALDKKRREELLYDALQFLGQQPPAELKSGDLKSIWDWALTHWSLQKVPKDRAKPMKPE